MTETYPIIDADVHIHEATQDLAQFAEGTLKRTLEMDRSAENWLDTPGYSPLTNYDAPVADDPRREVHVVRDRGQLRADLDTLGIDAAIVYTGRLLGTAARPDPAYAIGITRAYNRYLRERWLKPDGGIFGAIMVAPQQPRESAREIEECAQDPGFAAVYLPMASVYPLWGHREYDPIFAAAQEAGLPVVLQGYTHVYSIFPYQLQQFETALAKQALARPFGATANLVDMATSGALARYPRLKVVFTECGVTWLAPVLWRLDQQAQWTRAEIPYDTAKPSEAIMRQVYVTTHRLEAPNNPQTLIAIMQDLGLQDKVLFATDWPHYDADRVERIMGLPLSADWKRKILSDNARAVFRLPQIVTSRTA
jgi:predicted TIM-barrel fold metal-dependent hydrolase